jgi:hypothetical protein
MLWLSSFLSGVALHFVDQRAGAPAHVLVHQFGLVASAARTRVQPVRDCSANCSAVTIFFASTASSADASFVRASASSTLA